eukprot:CAMPEP_0168356294 /NCGR_PEP_ID=MMETSP0213-20121227/25067_1 /TAXON_ID=151035 /ORGANISM="Euplotes harpa, Strain FSP1.4" /LENGTH=309 /DNA_ID=CAMNT_0008368681 /DNA_START=119 /DNA_END=1049 /DNA_ORIENTATION=-
MIVAKTSLKYASVLESNCEQQETTQDRISDNSYLESDSLKDGRNSSADEKYGIIEETYADNEVRGWTLDLVKERKLKSRTSDRIRTDLLNKLTYKKIWLTPCEKPTSHQTLIIFDWDDTLLCTSFLSPSSGTGYNKLNSSSLLNKLSKLEESVERILKLATQLGQTYIITNAEGGWVEYSSQLYISKVYNVLSKLKIISARETYEKIYPGNPNEWKNQAFALTGEKLDESTITNIVVLGDSKIEMEAGVNLSKMYSTARIKTAKFRESPSPNELNNQLKLVLAKFEEIFPEETYADNEVHGWTLDLIKE